MKIWCISKYACPPSYGAGARLYYLAKEFVAQGHDVQMFSSDSNHLAGYPASDKPCVEEVVDGVAMTWFVNVKYKKTASLLRLVSWFDFEKSLFRMPLPKKGNGPDAVIVSSLSLLSVLYGVYLKKKYQCKLIFEVRDIWPLTLVEEGGVSPYHPLSLFLGLVEKYGYKKADLIVGTMPRLDLHVKNVLGYERPFYCSPLGFDSTVMSHRDNIKDESMEELFPEGKVVVGYAGSMGTTNNLDTFIHTIKGMIDVPCIHFMLVGAGDCRDKYESQLEGFENVTFLDRLQPEKVPCFLSLCDVLYLSTHDSKVWDFGQSMNKVVEYMYAAKPIVASYSGYPSMLNEADCGVFVAPNDTSELRSTLLQFASMGKQERKEVGLSGRSWVIENRDYKKLAADYMKEIELIKTN